MNKLSTPIPPGELINLVAGHTNADIFAASREPSLRDTLLPRLHECGVPLQGRMRILDFGCGCGRLLAAWEHFRTPSMTLNGIDINPQLVAFCRQHIPFAEVTETNFLPPTRFDDETFDFAYAVSVFTHLKLAPAMMWAGEFARIVRPGGTFVVTYHGVYFERALRAQSPTLADLLKNRGYTPSFTFRRMRPSRDQTSMERIIRPHS